MKRKIKIKMKARGKPKAKANDESDDNYKDVGENADKILRGFWDRGRVCGDRSVFVTLHRPAQSSRAHVFSLDRILHFAFEVFSVCMALRVYF